MTRMRVLLLALALGAAFCFPQLALANTSVEVTLSGTVAAAGAPHTYTLEVRQSDGTTVIGSRPSGPHAGGTGAATVASGPPGGLGGAYDANLSGTVAGAVVILTDTSNRDFRRYVKVDAGTFSEITVATPVTLAGITFTTTSVRSDGVPALSLSGLLIFLLIASGALFVLRRRRSGRMAV